MTLLPGIQANPKYISRSIRSRIERIFERKASRAQKVPRIIWMLWLQGWENAPDLIKACVESWRRLNPEWDLRLLTRADLTGLFDTHSPNAQLLSKEMPSDAFANVVRLELLARYGGVWADATTYCLVPLEDWIDSATISGFFAFDRPAPDRMLSNWFLAAPPASPAIMKWRALTEAYWFGRPARHTQFWHHYLFALIYASDAQHKAIWDKTPKIPADGPHSFMPYGDKLLGPATPSQKAVVTKGQFPLLKLTHKLPDRPIGDNSLYRWLCNRYMADTE